MEHVSIFIGIVPNFHLSKLSYGTLMEAVFLDQWQASRSRNRECDLRRAKLSEKTHRNLPDICVHWILQCEHQTDLSILGGELPTNRGCGLVHPSDLHGIRSGLIHINHWGEPTHLRAVGSSPPSRFVSNLGTSRITFWS